MLNGCATTPRAQDVPIANTKHIIYFIYRGWHTSVLIDAKTVARYSPLLTNDLRNEKFARVGWGDGDYFTGKSKTWGTAAKALIASHYSAVQLLTYDYDPFDEIPQDTIVPLAISDEGMRNLITHINNSIARDASDMPVRLPALGNAMGVFFQANGHYSVVSNCNTWSGQALRTAGMPVSSRLTASGVFAQAKAVSHIQSEAGLFKSITQTALTMRPNTL
jgi:uncharacterized protein (TIGR02117 family)